MLAVHAGATARVKRCPAHLAVEVVQLRTGLLVSRDAVSEGAPGASAVEYAQLPGRADLAQGPG